MTTRIHVPLIGLVIYTLAVLGAAFGIAVLVVEWRADDAGDRMAPGAADGAGTPTEITASEAEVLAVGYLYDFTDQNPASDERAALQEGFAPFCEATDRTSEGWHVRCGFRHTDGREFSRLFDLQVKDDGTVATDEEES